MTAAHRVAQPDTGGVALATIGGVLMGVGAAQTAGSHQDVWSSPWFDGGCALVAAGALLVTSALVTSALMVSWWRAWRRRAPATGTGTPAADHELSAASPLRLRLADESWRLFYSAVWAFGIAVRVTNLTDKPIIIAHYDLLSRPDMTQRPPLAQEVWNSASNWTAKLSSDHESELFAGEITVPPGESITRWFVDTAYAPLPDGGRPLLTFQVKDILDNTYELDIPARPPKIYRSQET